MRYLIDAYLLGAFQVFLSAFFFGCMAIFAKIAYAQGIDSLTVLTFRFIIAAILLWLYFSIFDSQSLVCNLRQLVILVAFGVIGYGTMSVLLFMSLERISAALTMMIFYTHPALIVLLTWFFYKEPLTATKLMALFLTLLGCGFLLQISIYDFKLSDGILFALGTSLVYACYLTCGQKILKKINPKTITIYVTTSLAIVFFIYNNPYPIIMEGNIEFKGWLMMSAIAIFSTCISILLLFSGIKKIGAAKASLISMFEPFTAVLLAYLLLGEHLTMYQLLGGALVLSGVFIIEWRHNE